MQSRSLAVLARSATLTALPSCRALSASAMDISAVCGGASTVDAATRQQQWGAGVESGAVTAPWQQRLADAVSQRVDGWRASLEALLGEHIWMAVPKRKVRGGRGRPTAASSGGGQRGCCVCFCCPANTTVCSLARSADPVAWRSGYPSLPWV